MTRQNACKQNSCKRNAFRQNSEVKMLVNKMPLKEMTR